MAFNRGGSGGSGGSTAGASGAKKGAWLRVGEILDSKTKPGKLYIKFKEDVTLAAGSTLLIQDPREELQEAVNNGRLTEARAEEMLAKIPGFVRYNLVLAPERN